RVGRNRAAGRRSADCLEHAMTHSSAFTPGSAAGPVLRVSLGLVAAELARITPRDKELLDLLDQHRTLTTDQITALSFTSPLPALPPPGPAPPPASPICTAGACWTGSGSTSGPAPSPGAGRLARSAPRSWPPGTGSRYPARSASATTPPGWPPPPVLGHLLAV